MKNKFKINDIVKCIDAPKYNTDLTLNKKYTITHVNERNSMVSVGGPKRWFSKRFELCEPNEQDNQGGIKNDQGKVDYTYLLKDLSEASESVCRVLEKGAQEYGRENYKKVEEIRYLKAILRHSVAILRGEYLDPQTKEPHSSHIASNGLILAQRHVKLKDQESKDQLKEDTDEDWVFNTGKVPDLPINTKVEALLQSGRRIIGYHSRIDFIKDLVSNNVFVKYRLFKGD